MEIGLVVIMCIIAVAIIALSVSEAVSLHRELKDLKKQLNNKKS